jgi:hypothetical protein
MTAMGSFAVFILKLDILTADPEVIAIEKGTLGGGVARHSHVNVRVGSPEVQPDDGNAGSSEEAIIGHVSVLGHRAPGCRVEV